jgi:hypothetical protein
VTKLTPKPEIILINIIPKLFKMSEETSQNSTPAIPVDGSGAIQIGDIRGSVPKMENPPPPPPSKD